MRNEPAVDAEEDFQDKSAIESAMSGITTIRCIRISCQRRRGDVSRRGVKIERDNNESVHTFQQSRFLKPITTARQRMEASSLSNELAEVVMYQVSTCRKRGVKRFFEFLSIVMA